MTSTPTMTCRGWCTRGDPHTSIDAAAKLAPKRTALHARVLEAFDRHGPMTDDELERLPEFSGYGPSTIRKRRSEVYQRQALRVCGEGVNRAGVQDAAVGTVCQKQYT